MARKIYISPYFHYMTYIEVAGKTHIVEFKGGISYGNYTRKGTFTTSNTALQEAIESDPRFGKEILLAKSIESDEQSTLAATPTVEEVHGITNLQEARDYLKGRGVAYQSLTSAAAVERKAAEYGVTFPDMV